MATAISMPRLGMTMEEGTVIEWPFSIGDAVAKDALILIIESEKAEVEITAPASGVLRHIFVDEGEIVPCGTLLAAITETTDEDFDAEAFKAAEDLPQEGAGTGLQVKQSAPKAEVAARPSERVDKPVAPAARGAAKKLGIDAQAVPGTGPGGRVTKEDVEAFAAAREALVSVAEGVALEVLCEGDGEPVVLLPGLGTDVSAFARQTPMLTERFRVYGVNPRGVGLSDAPDLESYEVAQTATDAAATYEGAAHVIGASLGAAAALELALLHPGRVKTLTLITPFVESSPRLSAIAESWPRMAAEASSETLAAALLPWFFSSNFLADSGARARTVRGLSQTVARVPAKTLERMIAGLTSWSGSRTADLARVGVPTLVIVAGEDLLTPDAATIAEAIPGATLVVVKGAGHAVALEASDSVNDALALHLA